MMASDQVRIDREVAHPPRATDFTKTWYWGSFIHGLLLMLGVFVPTFEVGHDANVVPLWVIFAVGVFQFSGSFMLIWGSRAALLLSRAWAAEQFGCFITGAGWLTYSIISFWGEPLSISEWALGLVFVVSLTVRYLTLREREVITRRVVEAGR